MSDSKQQDSENEMLQLVGGATGAAAGGTVGVAAGLALLSVAPPVGLVVLLFGPTVLGLLGFDNGYKNPKAALLGLAGTIGGLPIKKD